LITSTKWSEAYTELNIDREVVEVGTDLLLDGLTTGLGREVDVSLDSGRFAVESGLEDELGEFGTGWFVSLVHISAQGPAYLEPWRG
jgi:hypothetical protein